MNTDEPLRAREAAIERLMDPANRIELPRGWKFSREELYEEAVLRHAVVRTLWGKE
jgi:hypothetical protein